MKSKFLAACALYLCAGAAIAAAATVKPVVPLSAQAQIRTTAGTEAFVPTRLVIGFHYRFRIWSFKTATKTLTIRFADPRFASRRLYFTVQPFAGPIGTCAQGKQKTIQYDGNKVYWNGQIAWRCIGRASGNLKLLVSGAGLPNVALARVVASAKHL